MTLEKLEIQRNQSQTFALSVPIRNVKNYEMEVIDVLEHFFTFYSTVLMFEKINATVSIRYNSETAAVNDFGLDIKNNLYAISFEEKTASSNDERIISRVEKYEIEEIKKWVRSLAIRTESYNRFLKGDEIDSFNPIFSISDLSVSCSKAVLHSKHLLEAEIVEVVGLYEREDAQIKKVGNFFILNGDEKFSNAGFVNIDCSSGVIEIRINLYLSIHHESKYEEFRALEMAGELFTVNYPSAKAYRES
jgi:hypothetical protein